MATPAGQTIPTARRADALRVAHMVLALDHEKIGVEDPSVSAHVRLLRGFAVQLLTQAGQPLDPVSIPVPDSKPASVVGTATPAVAERVLKSLQDNLHRVEHSLTETKAELAETKVSFNNEKQGLTRQIRELEERCAALSKDNAEKTATIDELRKKVSTQAPSVRTVTPAELHQERETLDADRSALSAQRQEAADELQSLKLAREITTEGATKLERKEGRFETLLSIFRRFVKYLPQAQQAEFVGQFGTGGQSDGELKPTPSVASRRG